MVELKKEAVKDVTSLTKAAPVALAKTKEVLNQAVADLYVAHVALHQVHWYMRGRGFLVWHPKMDEYMEALDGQLDEISERLITLGGSPFSTLTEFLQNSESKKKLVNTVMLKKAWSVSLLSTVICQNFSKKVWMLLMKKVTM